MNYRAFHAFFDPHFCLYLKNDKFYLKDILHGYYNDLEAQYMDPL